jgi:protein-S-isoprenylcysteine O-methyltransferase Ste14
VASAFTAAYSRRLGEQRGQLASVILRNVLGIPLLGTAFVLAARRPAPLLLAGSIWAGVAGWMLMAAGATLIVWALTALRRRAAAPSVADTLVHHGPYALARHPLYDGVFGELLGAVLVRSTWPVILCCLLTAGWLIVQARVEELDLRQRVSGYADYMARVPRFIPRLGRR